MRNVSDYPASVQGHSLARITLEACMGNPGMKLKDPAYLDHIQSTDWTSIRMSPKRCDQSPIL